ncbi:NADP-dependent oxidoreductase [Nocardia jinanensis]|uniref:Zinc-binding alcohol dehydrogenase n=1 Tax=Nocardia jinanensis TaxID=382504 RepID=A0A917RJR7_9NOCA|nr:NADP-dependent oxidoreductase [Nocardia jinanensis]GGL11704.1 zinc-binding alcohol dehydrogenase [Nocardia jinanensis]
MRVVGSHTFGGPEVLEVVEMPVPQPGPGQVGIRVHHAAVNPTDLVLRAGRMPLGERVLPGPPYVPGMDAAGVVDAVGPDCDGRLAVGDAVVAVVDPLTTGGGAYAEHIIVPVGSVVHAPNGLQSSAAATVLMNALTARLGLDALHLSVGRTVLVTGAAGVLGGYAVQLAKAQGFVVVADAGPEDVSLVRGLGADTVLPRGAGFVDAVLDRVPGGVDGVVDAALLEAALLPAVAAEGAVASFRGWRGPAEREITVHPIFVSTRIADTTALQWLCEQAESGVISPRVAHVLSPDRAAAAHRMVAAGGLRGRIVLDFS